MTFKTSSTASAACRRLTGAAVTLLALVAPWQPASAQATPPLRIVVGFPAGGSSDSVARFLAEALRPKLDRPVLVENKAGAASRIAAEYVKNAPADGSVLLMVPNPVITQYPSVYKRLSYDPVKDFAPIGQVGTYPLFISVGPAVPETVQSIKDYVSWARQNPKGAFFGSPAAGSTPHFVGIMLGRASGVELSHVGYRGDAPGIQDLLGGQLPMSINVPAAQLPHLQSGKLRVLATTGAKRSPDVPNVPTTTELGLTSLKTSDWFGLFAPSATPKPTVAKLQQALQEVLSQPTMRANFTKLGIEPAFIPGDEFARRIKVETTAFADIVKAVGFTPED